MFPVILASLLIPRYADAVLWVVPRNPLKIQGEAEFLNPRVNTSRRLRATNGNEPDPARGNRCYPGKTQAWCFAPADKAMLEAWVAIESETLTPLVADEECFGSGAPAGPGEDSGLKAPSIEPLWSTAHGVDSFPLDVRPMPVPPSVAEGILRKNIRALRVDRVDNARPGSQKALATIWNYTVRQICNKEIDHMSAEELTSVWVALRGRFRDRG